VFANYLTLNGLHSQIKAHELQSRIAFSQTPTRGFPVLNDSGNNIFSLNPATSEFGEHNQVLIQLAKHKKRRHKKLPHHHRKAHHDAHKMSHHNHSGSAHKKHEKTSKHSKTAPKKSNSTQVTPFTKAKSMMAVIERDAAAGMKEMEVATKKIGKKTASLVKAMLTEKFMCNSTPKEQIAILKAHGLGPAANSRAEFQNGLVKMAALSPEESWKLGLKQVASIKYWPPKYYGIGVGVGASVSIAQASLGIQMVTDFDKTTHVYLTAAVDAGITDLARMGYSAASSAAGAAEKSATRARSGADADKRPGLERQNASKDLSPEEETSEEEKASQLDLSAGLDFAFFPPWTKLERSGASYVLSAGATEADVVGGGMAAVFEFDKQWKWATGGFGVDAAVGEAETVPNLNFAYQWAIRLD